MNPRLQIWLEAHGHDRSLLERDADGDIKRIPDGTFLLPWTVVFSLWIQQSWRAWAASLGYTHTRDGALPADQALLAGHTAAEFDAWLKGNPR